MKIVAKLTRVLPKETIATKNGSKDKQILVFEEEIKKKDDTYFTKTYAVEFFGDAVGYLDKYSEGDMCNVTIDVMSRHWKDDKYFSSINGRYIELAPATEQLEVQGDVAPEATKDEPPF